MMDKILKRSEIPVESTWDLTDIFGSDEIWQEEYASLNKLPETILSFKGKISKDPDMLLAYFKLEDELTVRLSKFYGYASCKGDEDTANTFYQDMRGKAMGTYSAISSAGAFAVPEIMSIPDDVLDGFYKASPALEQYRRNIYLIRRKAAHILSPECETILASASEMADSPDNIGSTLRNADLTYNSVTDKDGVEHQLTDGSFVPLLESADQEFREKVFNTYYSKIGEFKNTIAATLNGQFKQLIFYQRARKYPSTLEAALYSHEIPTDVYRNLIEAVHANLNKMYRYVALRKKLLGVKDVHIYDVYTPIVANAAQKIAYEQAKETVLKALGVLGTDYTDLLKTGFDSRWIDVCENVGKRSGAYSSGNAFPHPYVLLNYKDNLDSMFTLAHEMGHALHSYHSCRNQPVNLSDYVIFVAEVASTCNEVLLMKYLLAHTDDKNQRAYLINHFLDQFKGTIYRQTMFAEFELFMGEMAEKGETLTADMLSKKYYELNKLYFGPEMVLDEGIALEWARIPHFFYNYYVFQYATGFSAAVAIANRILSEGDEAVKDYKKFLSGGCSEDPISLLKIAGVDMSSPKPVNDALALFGDLVKELESM